MIEGIAVLAALGLGGVVLWQQRALRRARQGRPARRADDEVPFDDHLLALWASGEELWDVDVPGRRMHRRGVMPDRDRLDAGSSASLEEFQQTVHPDDRALVMTTMERVVQGVDEYADVSYRAGLKSGGWVWLHSRGRVAERDATGRVTRVVGTTRAISSLKENEQRLRLALISAAEELWEVDLKTGRVRRENELPELAMPAGDRAAMSAELVRRVHPDDIGELERQFGRTLKGKSPDFRATYRVLRGDGEYSWMSSQGQGLDPDEQGRPRRVIGTTRNVSDIKEGEQRLRLALEGSRGELWDIDMTSGRVAREGQLAHLALVGADGAVQFRELLETTHPDDAEALRNAMVSHAKGDAEGFEATFRLPDREGQWRWVLAQGRVMARDAQGWAKRMLGTVHDVTALKQVETELRRLNEELERRVAERTAEWSQSNADLRQSMEQLREAQRQLVESEKMAALGQLVAGVAHEINTPLGIGVTAASHLQQTFATIEAAQSDSSNAALTAALKSGRRCVELVLSNLGRADHLVKSFKQIAIDQSTETARRIAMREYLDEVLTSLQPVLKRTALKIDVICPPALELVTYAGAIYQILMNLVVNSVTHAFAPEQPGTLTIQVQVENAADGAPELLLIYRDDGRGMTPEVRARVFEPFFTTRRGLGGSGLGMHIVYNLVTQRLRGSIRCDSAPGEGVCFTVRFPIAGVRG